VTSRAVRVPLEIAVFAVIGLAAAVAGLDPAAVITVVAVAVLLIALSEFLISAREAPETEPPSVVAAPVSATIEADDREPEPTPQAAVSERVARAILLSGQPPLPPEPTKTEPATSSRPEPR
jgi:hypothetical protein